MTIANGYLQCPMTKQQQNIMHTLNGVIKRY